jgi:hypothetical protein
VFFQRDDLHTGHRLLLLQLLQQSIRRRTTGTALRCKQLNYDRLAASVWG